MIDNQLQRFWHTSLFSSPDANAAPVVVVIEGKQELSPSASSGITAVFCIGRESITLSLFDSGGAWRREVMGMFWCDAGGGPWHWMGVMGLDAKIHVGVNK